MADSKTTPSPHAIAQRALNGGKEPETISIEEHNRLAAQSTNWKETVRDIFDELHHGDVSVFKEGSGQKLAEKIVSMIEDRHYEYFCEPVVRTP